MVGANGLSSKTGNSKAVGVVRLPRGPVPLVKNAQHSVATNSGRVPVKASLSNGTLFAHKQIDGRGYNVSMTESGTALRTGLTKPHAERIVRGSATHQSARRLQAVSNLFGWSGQRNATGAGNALRTHSAMVRYSNMIAKR